jgi:hypothetical protein
VLGTIHLPRYIAQLVLAVCLITVMTLTGLVVSSAPARAAFAQSVQTVSTLTHASDLAHGVIADTPQILCGSTSGACP